MDRHFRSEFDTLAHIDMRSKAMYALGAIARGEHASKIAGDYAFRSAFANTLKEDPKRPLRPCAVPMSIEESESAPELQSAIFKLQIKAAMLFGDLAVSSCAVAELLVSGDACDGHCSIAEVSSWDTVGYRLMEGLGKFLSRSAAQTEDDVALLALKEGLTAVRPLLEPGDTCKALLAPQALETYHESQPIELEQATACDALSGGLHAALERIILLEELSAGTEMVDPEDEVQSIHELKIVADWANQNIGPAMCTGSRSEALSHKHEE